MQRKYRGDKKSIEARSDDGRIWTGKFFDAGRVTEFRDATLDEVEALAAKHGLRLAESR